MGGLINELNTSAMGMMLVDKNENKRSVSKRKTASISGGFQASLMSQRTEAKTNRSSLQQQQVYQNGAYNDVDNSQCSERGKVRCTIKSFE